MRIFITLTLVLLSLFSFGISYAADAKDERIPHYEAEEPSNKEEAIELYKNNSAKIKEILISKKLSNEATEMIHELTYPLEAAIKKFKQTFPKTTLELINELEREVNKVHYFSESDEIKESIIRKSFTKSEELFKEINNNNI